MRTKGKMRDTPGVSNQPPNMDWRLMVSNAPTPSTDSKVASGFDSRVAVNRRCTTLSVPARDGVGRRAGSRSSAKVSAVGTCTCSWGAGIILWWVALTAPAMAGTGAVAVAAVVAAAAAAASAGATSAMAAGSAAAV